ncbi:ATP-binding cassette domain-containing protein [Ferrimonas pelagia]|uniref:ABC transporter domain-containing protein n=1 Tax=Ferrimonas pelagia TaxID=1177826 RepID=A0ABP9EDQ7_9GAMM
MLEINKLCCNLGERTILQDVSLSLKPGEFLAVLGANGVGKSTLLNCLLGSADITQGTLLWQGCPLERMSRSERARTLALVPQQQEVAFSFSAEQMVLMGRTPHLGAFQSPSQTDLHHARRTLNELGAGHLARCQFNQLSGGERQLVLLARAMLQSESVLLLDEPTNHLDFRNRYHILNTVKQRCREHGTSVIAILHDPNLASMYADQVLMLAQAHTLAYGPSADVMTSQNISQLYGLPTCSHRVMDQEIFMPQSLPPSSATNIAIVTGPSGSGKTTTLMALYAHCQQQKQPVRGILCPGTMRDGRRFSSEIINLADGQRRPFGQRTDELDPITNTRFRFDPHGLALGQQALSPTSHHPDTTWIMDEVGPMELEGQGYGSTLAPLLALPGGKHIWVVRPDLVERVVQRWQLQPAAVIDAADSDALTQLKEFVAL